MKRTISRIIGIVLAMIVVAVPVAQAGTITGYSGAWAPFDTDSAVMTVDRTPGTSGSGFLYLFDLDDIGNSLFLLENANNRSVSAEIWFDYDTNAGKYVVSVGTTFIQMASENFGFYFVDSNQNRITAYDYDEPTNTGNGDPYVLYGPAGSDMKVSVYNAAPVPLPGSLALLLPGLLGILGIGWRKNKGV